MIHILRARDYRPCTIYKPAYIIRNPYSKFLESTAVPESHCGYAPDGNYHLRRARLSSLKLAQYTVPSNDKKECSSMSGIMEELLTPFMGLED